jgi:hypothetical protein
VEIKDIACMQNLINKHINDSARFVSRWVTRGTRS